MPTYPSRSRGSGGGGGLSLRNPANEFVGATLAACRTARDTFFNATANAAALSQYLSNQNLAIILNPTNSTDNVFETYLPGHAADTYNSTYWVSRTDAVQGRKGTAGKQGIYDIEIFQNSANIISVAPVGGSVVVETGVTAPPTGWTLAESAPSAGEDTYRSRYRVNPLTQTGTVTPAWSVPADIRKEIAIADIDARIASPALANNPTGTFDDIRLPASIARDSEITSAINNLKGGVDVAYDTLAELAAARVTAGTFASGMITLTRDGEADIVVDLTGLQRTDSQINALIQGALRSSVEGNSEQGISVTYQSDGTLDFAATTGGGVTIAGVLAAILAGTGIAIDDTVTNQITISSTGGGGVISTAHKLYAGWSDDVSISDSEILAGGVSDTNRVILPTGTGSKFMLIWRADADGGDPSEVHVGIAGSSRNLFGVATDRTINNISGKLIVSVNTWDTFYAGGETVRVV